MRSKCEIKTIASHLHETITRLMPAKELKSAILTLGPGSYETCLIRIYSPYLNAELEFQAVGHWSEVITVSVPCVLPILKSYGHAPLTIIYLDSSLYLNQTRLDAIQSSFAGHKITSRPQSVQMEFAAISHAGTLFDRSRDHS